MEHEYLKAFDCLFENVQSPNNNCVGFNEKRHGKIVSTRFEPYHDVTVYEDGYEERYYIGD